MKHVTLVLLALSAFTTQASAADAVQKPCEANYKQEGSFFAGRRFSTFDVLSGVEADAAFKRVYAEMVKSGFKVTNADKEMGMLTSEYVTTHNNASITLPLNVIIEAEGAGIKVTVNKTTPSGYATSQDFQIKQMCAIIDTASGK